MKCINKHTKKAVVILFIAVALCLTGCKSNSYDMSYQLNSDVSSFQLINITDKQTATPFASDLCVAANDIATSTVTMKDVASAGLFDTKNQNTIYAKNINKQIHPASLTKVLTALVALKHGSPDQLLTASENVIITESGAQLCGLKPGDQMTLDQALHILLIYSANDVAIMIAEGIAGNVSAFVDLMNEEAMAIGATNCHFMNPNGLTQDDHYVTAYDLYLIFQEALKYDLFKQTIQMTSYDTTYRDSRGSDKKLEIETSNLYLRGIYEAPPNVTVIGGKTGTTNAAGHCLILLSNSSNGTPYISVIMKDESREDLYTDMTSLMGLIK